MFASSPEAATLCQLDTGDCTDLARFGGGPGVPKIAPAKRYTVLSTIFRWQGSGSTAIFDDFYIFLCIFAGRQAVGSILNSRRTDDHDLISITSCYKVICSCSSYLIAI